MAKSLQNAIQPYPYTEDGRSSAGPILQICLLEAHIDGPVREGSIAIEYELVGFAVDVSSEGGC